MSSKAENLSTLVKVHGPALKKLTGRVSAPNLTAKITSQAEGGDSIFLSAAEALTDDELVQALEFYNSPAGKKDIRIGEEFGRDFANHTKFTAVPDVAPASKKTKLDRLVSKFDVEKTLSTFDPTPKISGKNLRNSLTSLYGQLSEAEIERILLFYESSAGTKCADAARVATSKIVKRLSI